MPPLPRYGAFPSKLMVCETYVYPLIMLYFLACLTQKHLFGEFIEFHPMAAFCYVNYIIICFCYACTVSPGPIAVVFNQSGEPHYTVDWSPLTDIPLDLADTYSYFVEVQGDDCGCLSQNLPSNVTNLVCSGWEANGQMCTISVRARSTSNRICPRPSSPNQPTRISILLQGTLCLVCMCVYACNT